MPPPQNTPLGCFVNSCATVDLNLNRFLMILTCRLLKQVEGTHTHSSSSKGLEDVFIKKRENKTENCEILIRNKDAKAKSLTVIHLYPGHPQIDRITTAAESPEYERSYYNYIPPSRHAPRTAELPHHTHTCSISSAEALKKT